MNETQELGLTVTELKARRPTLDGLDIPTKTEMQLLGVRFTASNAVPPGELWVIALTEDGHLATLVYNVATE